MIEVLYAVIFGFALVGGGVLVVSDTERKWDRLVFILLFALPILKMYLDTEFIWRGVVLGLLIGSVTTHLNYFILGVIGAILLVLHEEGTYEWVWRRIHPSSAPTDNIGAGQRGHISRQGSGMSAALMGTSTSMFSVPGLDVKTVALIRLSFFAFKNVNRKTIIGLESSLRLGDGRRYKAFHSIAADMQHRRVSLTEIVHPYWRAINGNHSSARVMFRDLCQIARSTGNTDKKTINNLVKIGQALGLSPQDMGVAIGNARG